MKRMREVAALRRVPMVAGSPEALPGQPVEEVGSVQEVVERLEQLLGLVCLVRG